MMARLKTWEKTLLPVSLVTTKPFARQVLKRNKLLLERIEDGTWDDYVGKVGCPHCLEVNEACSSCRWMVYKHRSFHHQPVGKCAYALFDGVNLYTTGNEVKFSVDEEWFRGKPTKISIRFLKAHVLWAERILDGTYKQYAKEKGIKRPVRDICR